MDTQKVSQLLARAEELLTKGWTQKEYARDAMYLPAFWAGDTATCWCLSGALRRAAIDVVASPRDYQDAAQVIYRSEGMLTIPEWNDHPDRTQEEVLGVVRRARVAMEQVAE